MWDDEENAERVLQQTAAREERLKESNKLKGKKKIHEGRKDNETMREFKNRIRNDSVSRIRELNKRLKNFNIR